MRCDDARRQLSERLDAPAGAVEAADGAVDDRLDVHLDACGACRDFAARLDQVRRHLHLQPVGAPPDVAPAVRQRLETRSTGPARRRRWDLSPVAAAFVVAFALAASVVGLTALPGAEATDLATLVRDGQRELRSLIADVEVVEHGWHPEVPTRRYEGRLVYAAPETLGLELEDRTAYPVTEPWRPNDVAVVIDEARAWQSGLASCPVAALPDCTPEQPRAHAVTGREPFDPVEPVPLDLVLPVASFGVGGEGRPLGEAEVDGRPTIGVEVTAARIAPLLDGILRAGNWRPVHPTDVAEVWLDAELGVPVHVELRVGRGVERERWAAANGLDEAPGAAVLTWRLRDLQVNEPGDVQLPAEPDGVEVSDRGFSDDRGAELTPGWLPDGMAQHRTGRTGEVRVTSFSDGRAWLAVRATDRWAGDRLFGGQGAVVRRVALDGAGVAYVTEGGDRVLLHGDRWDVEVVGSLSTDDLLQVAASLGVRGQAVPDDWAEASTATLDDARDAWPRLLTVPDDVEELAGPAVSLSDDAVVQSFAGGGERAVVLIQAARDRLGPPLDDLAMAVAVRGTQARYTPDRGTLEWVEDGQVVTLRSRSLGLSELLHLAETLEEAA